VTTRGHLNRQQIEVLLRPIKPGRVMQVQGQSHVPAYDVAAHLTRVFGFGGWDKEILSLQLVTEEATQTKGGNGQPGRPAWAVTYSCTLRLTVRDADGATVAHWEDGACGSSTQPQRGEAHDMALKSAISYALKRCAAFGLGDQFGLSLYNRGNTAALVGTTLVIPGTDEVDESPDLEEHIPVPESLGNDERQEVAAEGAVSPAISEATGSVGTAGLRECQRAVDKSGSPHPRPAAVPHESDPTASASITKSQIAQIHILKGQLGMSDEIYRARLEELHRVTSSKDLTCQQADDVIDAMRLKLDEVAV
jgi:hypothetical protein